ncbi:MAG: hypothetical protein OXR67_17270 [Chloroflexota bacterium]|nr:hypothetical protein [Chloroflexota bacterium]
MISEFNYTQRKRIESKHFKVELIEPSNDSLHSFNVELDLEELQLPSDAPLVVEASRGSAVMRFPWGTAGQPLAPINRELTDVPLVPSFRVMALVPDDSRRILALASQVKPRWERARSPGASELLYLLEEDLGQEVWRLDLPEGEELPVLKVNSKIDGISRTVRQDPAFRSLVFPEVVRSVLTKALLIEEAEQGDEEGYWYGWLGFISQFYNVECPGSSEFDTNDENRQEALLGWITGAVEAFTQYRFNASDIYARAGR